MFQALHGGDLAGAQAYLAMNKWPRYSTTDRFAGLRWGVRKRLQQIVISASGLRIR